MTGAGCREERQAKAAAETAASPNAIHVLPPVQPHSWLLTRPSASRPAAAATSPAPRRSGTAASSSTGSSRTARAAATKITTPTGTLMRNTQRQDSSVSKPPTVGPIAAAIAPTAAHTRTPTRRRSAGSAARRMPRLVGVIAAAPTA